MLVKGLCYLILSMDCSAIDCTPEDVLEEMGLFVFSKKNKQGLGQFRERKQKAQIG